MPRKSTDVRKFKSNADEADWYATPQGRRQTQREFARALKDGTLIRSTGSKIAKSDLKVTVDVDPVMAPGIPQVFCVIRRWVFESQDLVERLVESIVAVFLQNLREARSGPGQQFHYPTTFRCHASILDSAAVSPGEVADIFAPQPVLPDQYLVRGDNGNVCEF